MKESRKEHQRELEAKGNQSALMGSKENALNGKRKESAQEETLAVSATTRTNVEKQCNRPLLLQNRRLKATGKIFERKSSQRR